MLGKPGCLVRQTIHEGRRRRLLPLILLSLVFLTLAIAETVAAQAPLAVQAWVEEKAAAHPIVHALPEKKPFLIGNKLYKYADPDPGLRVLLWARFEEGEAAHPVAWINERDGKRVFYMSPGSREEMAHPQIQALLKAAVQWGLGRPR